MRDLVREVSGDGGGGRRSFSTGVSRVVRGPGDVAKAYEQARTAVVVGRRMQGRSARGALRRARGLPAAHASSRTRPSCGPSPRRRCTSSRATPRSVADLRHTLDVLLECNLNVAEAARVLHFHYNTLRYRIAKLEKMVGPFSTDPNLRLSLQVALQVLRLRPV